MVSVRFANAGSVILSIISWHPSQCGVRAAVQWGQGCSAMGSGLLFSGPFLGMAPAALGILSPMKAAIRLLHPLVRADPAQLSKSSQGSHPHNLALLISQIAL